MLDAYRDLIDGLTEESTTLRKMLGNPVSDDLPSDAYALLKDVRMREAVMLNRSQKIMRGESVNLRDIASEPRILKAAEQTESPEELLQGMILDRGELVSLLINLTLKDWERKVPHWVLGETTISDEVEQHLTWEEETLPRFEEALN